MGITTDNASNNITFIRSLNSWAIQKDISFDENLHFRCFAHIINLSVQEALSCLSKEISQVRLVIILFNLFINYYYFKYKLIIYII